jgi:signal peptidase II
MTLERHVAGFSSWWRRSGWLFIGAVVIALADQAVKLAVLAVQPRLTVIPDVFVGPYHWPMFNLADSAISIGVSLLAFASLRGSTSSTRGRASLGTGEP